MEHKPIYLDGVDVSGCRHLKNDGIKKPICRGGGCIGIYKSCLCANNTDCDFKQLARKTQECEQIKEKYEALKLENQEGYEIVAELKHECEELKSESFTRESLISMQEKDIDRYRKALEEIEEHYKKVIKNLTTCDDSYDANISIEALHNISNIINEAKEEE